MTKKIFLKNMNYLRGFAILNIIIIHIWTIPILYVEDLFYFHIWVFS